MSYVQLFPTNMLSLESILGFCHGIAKKGDSKVKYYQPSCISAISNSVFRWDSCKGSE